MKAIHCCKTMEMELTAWKAMIYDIVHKMETLSEGEKKNILPDMQDIHTLIEEMDKRIDDIRENCTPETGIAAIQPERKKFVGDVESLRTKVDDTLRVLGEGNADT